VQTTFLFLPLPEVTQVVVVGDIWAVVAEGESLLFLFATAGEARRHAAARAASEILEIFIANLFLNL
jgi:hypothetical protein